MPKIKKEPVYKIRRPVSAHFYNRTMEFEVKEFPNSKKPLEQSILGEWILDQAKRGVAVEFVSSQESPDFLIKEKDIVKGIELMRLSSLIEETNQVVSTSYEKKLKLRFGENLTFEMFPKVYKKIPKLKSNVGKILLKRIIETIKLYIKSEGGIVHWFNDLNIQINFSFKYSVKLFNPLIFTETYDEWFTKLTEKWNIDYTYNGRQSILLLFRTGSHIDLPSLNRMVNDLNQTIGNKFEQVWFLHVETIGSQFYLIDGKTNSN